jgi:hypothetical protein
MKYTLKAGIKNYLLLDSFKPHDFWRKTAIILMLTIFSSLIPLITLAQEQYEPFEVLGNHIARGVPGKITNEELIKILKENSVGGYVVFIMISKDGEQNKTTVMRCWEDGDWVC